MAEVVLAMSPSALATSAVNDLSLAIADGEFLVLLGPTGAGKTTTLRLVAGSKSRRRRSRSVDTMSPASRRRRATSLSSFSSTRSIRI